MICIYFKTEDGSRHQVWYDGPATLETKYAMAAKNGARGVAVWTANMGDAAMWGALHAAAAAYGRSGSAASSDSSEMSPPRKHFF